MADGTASWLGRCLRLRRLRASLHWRCRRCRHDWPPCRRGTPSCAASSPVRPTLCLRSITLSCLVLPRCPGAKLLQVFTIQFRAWCCLCSLLRIPACIDTFLSEAFFSTDSGCKRPSAPSQSYEHLSFAVCAWSRRGCSCAAAGAPGGAQQGAGRAGARGGDARAAAGTTRSCPLLPHFTQCLGSGAVPRPGHFC